MRDRQTDRQALAEPTWEEDPVSGAAQNFCCFLFGFLFLFFFFFFFLHAFLLAGFLYCVHEWAQHFYLIYVDISLPCLLFYVTFRSPPLSLTLSFPASAAAGNLFDCSSACISLYFFGYVCRSRMERDGKTERGTGWCIYFVSTCSWYLFYESNYLYWNMAYTWDSCVLLRHISIYYFWRACAEIWCCCQFLMVNMMFPLTSLADMQIFISGLRVPKSACVCVYVGVLVVLSLFARTWVSSLTCFLKKTWQRFHLQALPTPASAFGVCDYFLSSLKKFKCSFY